MSTIQTIFRQHGDEYIRAFGEAIPQSHVKVIKAMQQCRTGERGLHVFECPDCHEHHIANSSCGNRHCPVCQNKKASQWVYRQQSRLLPCNYFLATFTLPEELRVVARSHQRVMYDAMFKQSASALHTLEADKRFVGCNIAGFFGVLHTWGRQLQYHPHVHFIVTGGGLNANGLWKSSHPKFLVPVHALSPVFRARLRDAIKEKHPELFKLIKPAAWKWSKKWVAHSEPVGTGEQAYRYLARYVYQVYLSESAILRHDDGCVTLRYRKSGTNEPRTLRLVPMEFLRRFLQHVLPSRFCKVRHYGLHHSSKRATIKLLQAAMSFALGRDLPKPPEIEPLPLMTCPLCEAVMTFERRYTPNQRLSFESTSPRGPP